MPVDSELRDAPCLTERDIRANIALALEEHYALSQDIEFAVLIFPSKMDVMAKRLAFAQPTWHGYSPADITLPVQAPRDTPADTATVAGEDVR